MSNARSLFIPVRGENLTRRLIQLNAGLVLFGVGIGLMLRSGLGVPPWDVLHQGLAVQFGLTIGLWSVIVSFLLLILWLPLKERFGIGTILNAVVVGLMIDVTAELVPEAEALHIRGLMLVAGILLVGLASGLYIGSNFGPGPRDGLMTGIARRGLSIRLTRSIIEVVVLVSGWLLGGSFGIGTLVFAFLIGPLVQFFLPRWTVNTGRREDAWDHPAR